MQVEWYGQSAFRLTDGATTVFIDPFDDLTPLAERGLRWEHPAIEGVEADLVLVTHEHRDHNAVDVVGGSPIVLRSKAGRLESPVGEVVAVASEHDDAAGTTRGSNTIVCFSLDGVRVCHLGDLGQPALRPEQREAIGEVDVLFVPVGGGPTIGGAAAAELVRSLAPRLVIPMHYRTPAVDFVEPPDEFLDALGAPVERIETSEADVDDLLRRVNAPTVALFAAPVA